jgi:hypothetical protein
MKLALAVALLAASPLAAYRDVHRVLVAAAARADDPALARQRALFAQMGRQAQLRDLVLVEAVGDGERARAIRAALGLKGGFAAALIGKDGEAKLVSAHPLAAADLFPLIDSMPMRRQEMRERGE